MLKVVTRLKQEIRKAEKSKIMFLLALRRHWRDLLSGFWLIPGLIFLLEPALAFLCLFLDHRETYPAMFLSTFSSPGAVRSVLSAASGVLISITALIFSITLVALQLISSQVTPRAIRGLLSDRVNQVTTGALVGIFAYCQIILIDVRDAAPTHGPLFLSLESALPRCCSLPDWGSCSCSSVTPYILFRLPISRPTLPGKHCRRCGGRTLIF